MEHELHTMFNKKMPLCNFCLFMSLYTFHIKEWAVDHACLLYAFLKPSYVYKSYHTLHKSYKQFHMQAKDRGGLNQQVALDSSKIDYHYFRWCFGENLFFRADGTEDSDPIHFWYPWLSENLKSSPMIESLKFKPSPNFSLEALIRAHTPGTLNQQVIFLE